MKLIFAAVFIAALSGCVSTQFLRPPGVSEAQFNKDKQECIYQADLHTQGAGANPLAALQLVPECLEAKGYTALN